MLNGTDFAIPHINAYNYIMFLNVNITSVRLVRLVDNACAPKGTLHLGTP